ncbi:putative gustatory receptor 59d [Drosophila montana]|uniref:putative gustatory receptor 59d n=1 Tax=Drosophila montana TaxID=40370 RepID=UPI00313F2B74
MATMFNRWWQRRRLIRLVNAFRGLAIRKPQVMRMWRRGVILKFISISLSEFLQILVSFLSLRPYLTVNLASSIFVLYTLTVLVNVIISHYYFAIVNVHSHYILLNQELHEVLVEIRSLEGEHRKAAFMIKCCTFADRLEVIAGTQYEVQTLLEHITKIFGIQGIVITINSYISILATIYFSFSSVKKIRGVEWTPLYILLFVLNIVCYFADILITLNNVYFVLEVHAYMVKLLERLIMFSPALDERLQAVIESFQLQITRNPLKISLLNLFNMDRSRSMLMANSLVTNLLVLIQYDMKNPRE